MNNAFLYPSEMPGRILVFTSKNTGGSASGVYGSFNTGIFTEDDKKAVAGNIEYLKAAHGITNLGLLKQVHGNKVLTVSRNNFDEIYLSEGDGLFTEEEDTALGIFTADCFPVLLAGKNHIAALHCGWRGLNSGIIENALGLFSEKGDFPEYAYIGPGICADCYEVKEDMISRLDRRYNPEEALRPGGKGAYRLDLRKLVENALKINKIESYLFAGETSCCSDGFYSYRKSSGVTGRMLSVIMRRGK